MPLIRIRDLGNSSTETRYTGPFDPNHIVDRGDYLIGMDGDFACYRWNGPRALLNQRVCRLRDFSDAVVPEFIRFRINQELSAINHRTSFVTVKHISSRQIEDIEIALPTPSEQRRIAELLEQADSLRRLRSETDKLAEKVTPALFLKMFGSPDFNPRSWPTRPFEETCDDVTAGHAKTQRKDYLATGTHPIVDQGQQLISGFTNNMASLFRGDLPVVAFGDHTRIFKFVDFPFGIGADGIRLFRPNIDSLPLFFYWQLRLLSIPSAGYSRHYKFLRDKQLMIPPKDIQATFESQASQIRQLTAEFESSKAKIDTIFKAMLCTSFDGHLTARWRQNHMQQLLDEMEIQSRYLASRTEATA